VPGLSGHILGIRSADLSKPLAIVVVDAAVFIVLLDVFFLIHPERFYILQMLT
jgi:hypothetical protein